MPHLTTWINSNAEKGFYAIELINNGIGPALIEEFLVKVDGKIISGQGTETIKNVLSAIFILLLINSVLASQEIATV